MPLNQMPVLEVDGVMIAPTQTIHRFIGNEFGRFSFNTFLKNKFVNHKISNQIIIDFLLPK